MPRRHRSGRERPAPEPIRPPSGVAPGWAHVEGWTVRTSTKGGSICPYCDRPIQDGKQHVVAFPDEDLDLRRHWHTGCWERELRRGGP
jgi:hypothetical protein